MVVTIRRCTMSAYKIGQIVRVVCAIDTEIHDVSKRIGNIGEVLRFGGVGLFSNDPGFAEMIHVGFCDGTEESFWPEELGAL